MRLHSLPLLAFVALLSCRTMTPHETGFLIRSVTVRGTAYPYTVYVPRAFDASKRWPVILFLHGAGERGADGLKSTQIAVAAAIRANPDRVPAIAIFPQAPLDSRWLGDPADAAMAALEQSIAEFDGDRSRIYLTGLSMGGYGTWHLALAHPDTFAALVIVCGGLLPHETAGAVQQSPLTMGKGDPYAFTAHALRHLPIRIVHGDADPVIPVTESRRMAEALKSEGAEVTYIELAGVGHNAWDRAYGDAELWRWLFQQSVRRR
ncbi:MAG TPA: prolyl oligopeptidase family serine peptidase [Thermoanaerobaculia bacterium]|jgi:predicted peptidase|nr:prolyl oligopeptidase family serine peptidase [Thermoanaerobaculia bacterium]